MSSRSKAHPLLLLSSTSSPPPRSPRLPSRPPASSSFPPESTASHEHQNSGRAVGEASTGEVRVRATHPRRHCSTVVSTPEPWQILSPASACSAMPTGSRHGRRVPRLSTRSMRSRASSHPSCWEALCIGRDRVVSTAEGGVMSTCWTGMDSFSSSTLGLTVRGPCPFSIGWQKHKQ